MLMLNAQLWEGLAWDVGGAATSLEPADLLEKEKGTVKPSKVTLETGLCPMLVSFWSS